MRAVVDACLNQKFAGMPPQPLDVVLGGRQARLERTVAAFSTLHDFSLRRFAKVIAGIL
jgi:hypothetical protein